MITSGSRARAYLLASTALLAAPGVASAQTGKIDRADVVREAQGASGTVGAPTNVYREAQQGTGELNDPTNAYREAQGGNVVKVAPEPEILIANPNTPTTARDPVNITGIGQMVVDTQDGFIGLCTATLINPRVVIFAAHCVNSTSASTYGANSGGRPIGFGFETNTRANAAGQPDELLNWYNGGSTGPGKNKTNIAQAFFNSNWVTYNPLSLEPAAQSFLYGDVALASLDTPAANVPTWALLFSQLTNTSTIGAAGTGFNVGIVGYGNNGTGQTGAAGIDYRRRAADNVLGALTDLQTFESFLFGGPPNGLTQNLYFLDFDDPRRGMATASPFDFNAFRDNARGAGTTNPTEGITSQGDSGGPLILQNTFAKQVVIGVLSGGYNRFFNGQPNNGYGTVSFYQPLYLYWDWIAANNPYHYVAAKAGDASWTDATHWVSTLDPAYMIASGGQLVNGIPTLTGEQKDGTSGDFGQICFQSGGTSDCYDTRTGTETVEARPIGTADNQPATGTATDSSATADATTPQAVNRGDLLPDIKPEAQAAATALPPATLANGLPGATNFVPNNADPVRTGNTISTPRYFDVTLAATGTTTLSGAAVTIDRLTLGANGAQLVVAQGASLTSLINVNHFAGFNTVNGTLTSVGDYSLFGGGLLGSGRVNAPFVTSVLGQFAPGTTSTIGTLTIGGNLVMSNGTSTFINLGGGNTSDLLAVVANGSSTGTANIGGSVVFSPVAGATVRDTDLYTILTAQGGRTGTFSPTSSLSAILTPTFIYSTNAVQVRLTAGLYANVVANTPVQQAYARLLDNNRAANRTRLGGLYDFLDLQSAATIQATLEGLAPRTETLVRSLGTAAVDNMDRMYRGRVESLDVRGDYDGSLAIVGSPLQVLASSSAAGAMTSGAAAATTTLQPDADVQPGRLPDGLRGFIAGGYLDGKARSMPTAVPFGGKDKFDGWYVAAGVEAMAGENSAIGFGLSYSDLDGDTRGAPQQVGGKFYQGTLYGKTESDSGIVLDGRVSAGQLSISTRRAAVVGPNTYDLRSKDRTLAVSSEVGLSKLFGDTLKFGPRVAFRGSNIGFSKTVETGGPAALYFSRNEKGSAQGLAGLTLSSSGMSFKPYASAYYVHDFLDQPAAFGANFVGGAGGNSLFALAGQDKDWGEVAVGVSFGSDRFSVSLGADSTIFRKDVENQAYRGSVSIKF